MEIYRQQIADMDESIEDLKTDRDSLEKFARERFHFAASGEDVYLIEE
jgi:cell division protein FtsB